MMKMRKEEPARQQRRILVTESTLEELAKTEKGEEGYLFFYIPPKVNEAYSLLKIKLTDIEAEGPILADVKIIEYFANNLDALPVPYKHMADFGDEKQHFALALDFYDASEGLMNLFLGVKEKKPEFYTLLRDHGIIKWPQYYEIIKNNTVLLYGSRISEIMADVQKLRISGSVEHQ